MYISELLASVEDESGRQTHAERMKGFPAVLTVDGSMFQSMAIVGKKELLKTSLVVLSW